MYTLAIKRDFIAQHYLIGGDWGAENQKHSHHYLLEVRLEGDSLDQHGYLVDIVDLEQALDHLVSRYRERTLNEQPEFAGLNPSLEHFSRILCQALSGQVQAPNIRTVTLRLWESEDAWASFRQEK
jgi:6-pyruvoyltetrahydropterin/6-carboxytetrahydropterin synthase